MQVRLQRPCCQPSILNYLEGGNCTDEHICWAGIETQMERTDKWARQGRGGWDRGETEIDICTLFVVAVQLLSPVQLFTIPWTTALQASLSSTVSWSLLKLRSIELEMLLLLIHPIYNTYSLPLLIPCSQSQISHFLVLSPQRLIFFFQSLFKVPLWFYFIGLYSYFSRDWPYERIQCPSTSFTVSTALLFLLKWAG